jgi:hypothetical protein
MTMSKPKYKERGQEKPKDPIQVDRQRMFPELTLDQMKDARIGLTQSMIFANNHIQRLYQNPQIVAAMGISERNLALHLAHLTITHRTLQEMAYFLSEDIDTTESNQTLNIVTGPTLVDANGNPLVN